MRPLLPVHPGRPRRALPFRALFAAALALAAAGCGGDGGTNTQPNPTPGIASLNPAGVMQGSGAFTLTVDGSDFVQGAQVRWGDAPRPTTWVSATRLTAQIAAADVEQAGTAQVTVLNPAPGGGVSNSVPLQISEIPPAQITALSPATIMVNVGGTITVTGTGFVAGSRVSLGGGSSFAATVESSTQLKFTLSPLNVPIGFVAQVTVLTPAGAPSNPLPLAIANPIPVVTGSTPTQAVVGGDSLVVSVTGTGFVQQTLAHIAGTSRTLRRISATQVEVVLNAADLAATGTRSVAIVNPAPGGGGTGIQVQVVNPAPTLASVSPAQAEAGQDSLVVRLTGTGFLPATEVRVNGNPRTARRVSPTAMDAVLSAEDLSAAGTYAVTAVNPQPGGGTSGAASVTLTAPAPVITTLPAYGAMAGGGGFELVVHGTGFLRTSQVRWNGVERTTRYISATRLAVGVTPADVASPRTVSVSVHTPGGGTSAAAQITVRTHMMATITSVRSLDLPARDIVYDAGRDRIYASIDSSGGTRANTVVAIDPTTGTVTASVAVGTQPGALALSDDGGTLWVAVDGTAQVRRVVLPSFTVGTTFSIGNPGTVEVGDMEVMPGRAGTLAVSLRSTCCTPRYEGLAIYDIGVRRPRMDDGHTGPNTIAWDESGSVVYGLSNENNASFYTWRVQSDGVVKARETEYLLNGGYDRMQYAGGRAYSFGRDVADAGRHVAVGQFTGVGTPSSMALDVATGRVFYVDTSARTLRVYDMYTFHLLSSVSLSVGASQHPALTTERLVRWGTDGLALSDGERIHLLRTTIAAP